MKKSNNFLGFTSNMGTSGLRDIIAYLTKNNLVQVLVTTAGAIEEDIIKTQKPFVLGSFDASGELLREQGINRSGNIYVPNDRYIFLEGFMYEVYRALYEKQKKENVVANTMDLLNAIGERL